MYKTNKLISNGIVTTKLLLIFSFSPSVFYHKYLIVMKECKLPEVTALFMTVVKKCDILKVRAIKNKGINSQADGTHSPTSLLYLEILPREFPVYLVVLLWLFRLHFLRLRNLVCGSRCPNIFVLTVLSASTPI